MKATIFATALSLCAAPLWAQDQVTLLLDWFVNPDHGPVIIAQENGYFAEQNLAVEVIAPADPSAPPKMVAAGQADLAISYQPQLHLQIHEGLPLQRVGIPLSCLLVLGDGPIQSPADLMRRKVGFSVGGVEKEGLPPYDELIYVANKDTMDIDMIQRFLAATEKATQYIINHPDESWEVFASTAPELNDELNKRAWVDTLPRVALRPTAMGDGRNATFEAFLHDAELIPSINSVSDIAIDVTAQ